jgi:cellulose 1,4-beta-cellobiosidase
MPAAPQIEPRNINPFVNHRIVGDAKYEVEINNLSKLANAAEDVQLNKLRKPVAIWLVNNAATTTEDVKRGIQKAKDIPDNPLTVNQFVVYNLPARDCGANSSANSLIMTLSGYHTYINAIKTGVYQSGRSTNNRIIFYIEPDAIPNIITKEGQFKCTPEVIENYKLGLIYAIRELSELPNTYIYLDMGHSNWMKEDDKQRKAAAYVRGLGVSSLLSGFTTNVSQYNTLHQERVHTDGFIANLQANGLPAKFVVDVSRAGQQGFLRHDTGSWCNLKNAIIGPTPAATPHLLNIHAAVWIKPPGSSDGTASKDAVCGNADALQGVWEPAGTSSLRIALSQAS